MAKRQNHPKVPKKLTIKCFLDFSNLSDPFNLSALTRRFQEKVLELLPNPDSTVGGRNQQDTVATINQDMLDQSKAPLYFDEQNRPSKFGVPRFKTLEEATTLQKNNRPPGYAIINSVQFRVDITRIDSEEELNAMALELAKMWVGVSGPCTFQPLLARRYPTPQYCPNPWCTEDLCTGFHIRLTENSQNMENARFVADAFMQELKKDLAKSSSSDNPPRIRFNKEHLSSWQRYASEKLGMDTGNGRHAPSFETQLLQLQGRVATSEAAVSERVNSLETGFAKLESATVDTLEQMHHRVGAVEGRVGDVEASVAFAHQRINDTLGDIGMALRDVHALLAELQAAQGRVGRLLAATETPMVPPMGGMMVHMSQPLQTYGYPVMPASAMPASGMPASGMPTLLQSAWHSPDPFSLPVPTCPDCSSALTKGADCRYLSCRDVDCKGCHSSGCDWLSCRCGYNVIAHIQSTTRQQSPCAHARCKTPSP